MNGKEILSVTEVIVERIRSNSKPWKRDDPWKVGLIPEGGGMRGVISGGMAVGLQALDAFSAFDSIYSASSGSCAAMYFAADQTSLGTSIYYQDINNSEFIDFSRFFKRKPIIDILLLTHHIMWSVKPLDWRKILDAPIPIHTYITSAKDTQIIDQSNYLSRGDVHSSMHYSSRIPIACGMPIEVNGKFLTDGGVLTGGVPVEDATQDGCTHILVLLTRPDGTKKKPTSILDVIATQILKQSGFPELASRYWDGIRSYGKTLDMIKKAETDPTHTPKIEAIRINSFNISRFETDGPFLRNGAIAGYTSAMRKFQRFNLPIENGVNII